MPYRLQRRARTANVFQRARRRAVAAKELGRADGIERVESDAEGTVFVLERAVVQAV